MAINGHASICRYPDPIPKTNQADAVLDCGRWFDGSVTAKSDHVGVRRQPVTRFAAHDDELGFEMPNAGSTRIGEGRSRNSVRAPPSGMNHIRCGEPLLTPQDIAARLNIESCEVRRWMKRIFRKHGVPFVNVCGQPRATEEQFAKLMESMKCSQSDPVENTARSTSVARSRSVTSASSSQNIVQARVTAMLHRT